MKVEKRIVKHCDGSYVETYHKKGNVKYWHREDGPAQIEYNEDGSIAYETYWVNDEYLSKEEWEQEFGWKSKLKGTPMGAIFGVKNE